MSIFIGHILTVVRPNIRAGGIGHQEGDAGERFILAPLNIFLEDEGLGGGVVKGQLIGDSALDHDGLGLSILDVARGRGLLTHHHRHAGGESRDRDQTVAPAGVAALVGANGGASAVGHQEDGVLQRLVVGCAPLQDREVA